MIEWLRQKLCKHPTPWRYEEVRTGEGIKRSWSAFLECPECEKIMVVEASYYGNPQLVALALEEDIWGKQ